MKIYRPYICIVQLHQFAKERRNAATLLRESISIRDRSRAIVERLNYGASRRIPLNSRMRRIRSDRYTSTGTPRHNRGTTQEGGQRLMQEAYWLGGGARLE